MPDGWLFVLLAVVYFFNLEKLYLTLINEVNEAKCVSIINTNKTLKVITVQQ